MIKELNKESFKKRVHNYELDKEEWNFQGDKPCIIDFYADWCQPCKMLAPILEDIAKEYEGKIDVYKVNTESEQEIISFIWNKKYSFSFICSYGRFSSNGSWYVG